jgi:hypothetical protein
MKVANYKQATIENDIRQSAGKEFYEYWAGEFFEMLQFLRQRSVLIMLSALLPQSEVKHQVQLLWSSKTLDIPPSPSCKLYETRQWSYETENPVALDSFGPTVRGPLG